MNTEFPETRKLTLELPESEWRELRNAEPDAVGWLQSQIRARLAAEQPAKRATPPDFSVEDDY